MTPEDKAAVDRLIKITEDKIKAQTGKPSPSLSQSINTIIQKGPATSPLSPPARARASSQPQNSRPLTPFPTWEDMVRSAVNSGVVGRLDEARFYLELAREIRLKETADAMEFNRIRAALEEEADEGGL